MDRFDSYCNALCYIKIPAELVDNSILINKKLIEYMGLGNNRATWFKSIEVAEAAGFRASKR